MSEGEIRDSLISSAKLAEQAERYDDMVDVMNKVAKLGVALTAEERNLLSVAYKNVVGTRRSSWRVIYSINQREDHNEKKKEIAQQYLTKISSEIEKICEDVVELIDAHLLKTEDNSDYDSQTFYMKMKGDYYRYVAEVVPEEKKEGFATKADTAYSEAYELCKKEMLPYHPIRLGLALNYSVFYYEIKGEHSKASEIAQDAYDQAIAEIDVLEDHHHKDSTLIMQLLRDNLTLWTAKDDDDEEIDDAPAE